MNFEKFLKNTIRSHRIFEISFYRAFQKYANYYSKNSLKNYSLILLSTPYYYISEWSHRKELRYSHIEVPITPACNLRCPECVNLMPYYPKGVKDLNLSIDEMIKGTELLLETIDYVYIFKILGGEPFLNRELGDYLEYLVNSDLVKEKVLELQIVTNGTVIPDKKSIEILGNNKQITVLISNYGKKSEKIVKTLEEHGISYNLSEFDDGWIDPGDLSCRNRDEKELKDIYKICGSKASCNSYFKNKFFICARQGHGIDLGLVPDNKKEYVSMDEGSIEERREKLFKLRDLDYISTCDYCDCPLEIVIKKRGDV